MHFKNRLKPFLTLAFSVAISAIYILPQARAGQAYGTFNPTILQGPEQANDKKLEIGRAHV